MAVSIDTIDADIAYNKLLHIVNIISNGKDTSIVFMKSLIR